jgi:hypothetical protein
LGRFVNFCSVGVRFSARATPPQSPAGPVARG